MGRCCDNWCVAVTVRLQRTAASGLAVHNLAMVAAGPGRGAQVCLLSAQANAPPQGLISSWGLSSCQILMLGYVYAFASLNLYIGIGTLSCVL